MPLALAIALATTTHVACGDAGKRPLGTECESAGQCASGLCQAGRCLDPAADDDQDGLSNGIEAALGSDATLADTDGDGISDPEELATGQGLRDTDGDGKPDIIESTISDRDADCITDQYDADDSVPATDVSPMIDAVCPTSGVCAHERGNLRASCPDGQRAVCILDDVAGFADPETACDGVDENCDGRTDEGFPAGCRGARPFLSMSSGTRTSATARHKAVLSFGRGAVQATWSARHKAFIGATPIVSPRTNTKP